MRTGPVIYLTRGGRKGTSPSSVSSTMSSPASTYSQVISAIMLEDSLHLLHGPKARRCVQTLLAASPGQGWRAPPYDRAGAWHWMRRRGFSRNYVLGPHAGRPLAVATWSSLKSGSSMRQSSPNCSLVQREAVVVAHGQDDVVR